MTVYCGHFFFQLQLCTDTTNWRKVFLSMNIVIQRTAKQYLQLASRHRQFCVHMKINSGFAGPVPAANQMASSTAYHFQSVGVSQESVLNPGQTIQFELPVIDTHPGDNERPVVLGVHGAPGLAADFEPLIRMLSERNVRFIAPTFPGRSLMSGRCRILNLTKILSPRGLARTIEDSITL